MFYTLYRAGVFLALNFPLKFCYGVAIFLADMHYFLWAKERRAVTENLKVVLGKSSCDKELSMAVRDSFRNFAKYLVDFFRFSKTEDSYIKKFIKFEGISNIDEALKHNKGVIMLSAHLGNWELGGFVLGRLGYPIHAVALTHQNIRINNFFRNQRAIGKLKSIEYGASLRGCYKALKDNELLALLGDRDFSNSGLSRKFFGKSVVLPKGPATLSYRTGALIVPSFITRNSDDTFKFTFEKPIMPVDADNEDAAVKSIMDKYLPIVETYIKKYPGQWYVFRNFWNPLNEELCSNTIV